MSEALFPIITKHFNILPKDEKHLWDNEWSISLSDDGKSEVGRLLFEGGIVQGEVTTDLELEPEYDKTKYVEEIFFAIARFIFRYHGIKEVSTKCRHENDNRVRGLEKAGFVRRETIDGSDYYSIKKQKTSWTGLYMFIGLIAGFLIGLVLSNLWLGTISGVLIGIIIGFLMDKKEQD